MAKNKKKSAKEPAPLKPEPATAPLTEATRAVAEECGEESPAPDVETAMSPPDATLPPSQSLLRRLLPDLIKIALAFLVIGLGVAIWYQPLLFQTSHPYVSYTFGGQKATDAKLYRPLAMPTRYYIELPRQLAGRYTWFAVDRRREVAALAVEPRHRLFGKYAIKRSDPLGLDLEFRKLDHSEWQVHFFDDAIVFSNAVLSISLDLEIDK